VGVNLVDVTEDLKDRGQALHSFFGVTCPRGTMFVKTVDATLEVKDAIPFFCLLTGADDCLLFVWR
jgi:hypothetical protein